MIMELTKTSVKDWSPEDQPREKLLSKGVNSLSDAELIAIILRSGTKEETVVELSQRVLRSFGNDLNRLGKVSAIQLMSDFKGIGEAKAVGIIAALELGRRRRAEDINSRKKISSSLDVYYYFYPFLCDLMYEEFWALFLNHSNRIIEKVKISQGGTNETIVDGKIIYKEALARLASYVVLCHNHPSGNYMPSQNDDVITAKVKKGLEILGIRLYDHVILTNGKYYSYSDNGRIT